MLLLDGENPFHHASRRRIIVAEITNHLAITIDRDTFGDEILSNHVDQRIAFDVFGVTARQQPFRIEIRRAAQLNYSLRDLIGMSLLFVGFTLYLFTVSARMLPSG